MDWNNNGLELARHIKETAKHSIKWYRRAAVIGRIAAVLALLCSLAVIGYDFWREWNGFSAISLFSGVVPGNFAAHVYFCFVQDIAFQLGDRRVVLLAAFGALAIFSLEVLLFVRVFRSHTMKGLAIFLFLDAYASYFVGCMLLPFGQYLFLSSVFRMLLRAGLGILLLIGHSAEKWKEWIFAADETLWAAEKYNWSERFNPLTLNDEEWEKIHREYLQYLNKKGESQ